MPRLRKEAGSLTTGSGHISFFGNAPHPNAARVHFNWLVSREGRIAWQKHTGENSLRTDIPKESLPGGQNQVPKEGRTYLRPVFRNTKT